ncbi:MAG TPA: T9SS type A sorting domain-containing protein [Bacteroidia bacterium]|jgi:hypothetical protein|nr:T9SS type A sorting domain-containing protein [Bacteroidia bacterium]
MKKLYTTILSATLIAAGLAAQPTLTASSINPAVGDVYNTVTSAYVSPGSSGANQTWNLALTNNGTVAQSAVAPGTTPYAATYPTATVALSSSGNYTYYKTSTSSWQNIGVVNGSGTQIVYSNVEDMMHFPGNYNDTYTDPWAATFVQSTYTYYRTGNTTVTDDAYGTLTTPVGTFNNVMRVHFVQIYQDSTNISSQPFVINYNNDEYMWFLNGNHFPIAAVYTLTISSAGTQQGGFYMTNAVGIPEQTTLSSFSALPNPANDVVTFNYTLQAKNEVTLHLYNNLGQEMELPETASGIVGENKLQVNVADLPEGIYYATLSVNGEKGVTQKIVVTH